MLASRDFNGIRRKRLPIFMLGREIMPFKLHRKADATFPASVIGSRTGANMMHPCVIAGA